MSIFSDWKSQPSIFLFLFLSFYFLLFPNIFIFIFLNSLFYSFFYFLFSLLSSFSFFFLSSAAVLLPSGEAKAPPLRNSVWGGGTCCGCTRVGEGRNSKTEDNMRVDWCWCWCLISNLQRGQKAENKVLIRFYFAIFTIKKSIIHCPRTHLLATPFPQSQVTQMMRPRQQLCSIQSNAGHFDVSS